MAKKQNQTTPHTPSHEEYVRLTQAHSRQELLNNKSLSKQSFIKFETLNAHLDKYYTKPSIAKECYENYISSLTNIHLDIQHYLCVEPSAGAGVFLNYLPSNHLGLDIAPSVPGIIKHDFLKDNFLEVIKNNTNSKAPIIFIGNPPFGTKSTLAIAFLNQALSLGAAVGFIVPLQFRKWSVQSKISSQGLLYKDFDLPEVAFEFMGKDYQLRCCFQIWLNPDFLSPIQNSKLISQPNLRISKKPLTDHPDFLMYQYNCTLDARKYFDYDWDFAVPRQGYSNYGLRITDKKDTNFRQQWIFFKAKNKKVLTRLNNLDFEILSKKNIGVPGFGKADVVALYDKLYSQKKQN